MRSAAAAKSSKTRHLLSSLGGHRSYFVRGNLIKIDIGRLHGRILLGDLRGFDVVIDVPLDHQLSRLFIDGAKIAGLYYVERWLNALPDKEVNRDANEDVSGR